MSTGTTENVVSSNEPPAKGMKFSFMPEVHEQLAYVAAAWSSNGMVNLQSQDLKNISKTIVAEDIETYRASAIQKLRDALSKVPADQRGDLEAKIDAVASAPNITQIDALTTEALRDMATATGFSNTGVNIQDQQSREDEQKFLADMVRWDELANAFDEKWTKKGYHDEAYEKRKKQIEEEQKQYPPESKEWLKLEEEKLQLRVNHDGKVADQAARNNDGVTEAEARTQKQEAQERLEKVHELYNSKETKKNAEKTAKVEQISEDEDEPNVVQNTNVTSPAVVKPETKQEQIEIGQLAAPQFAGAKQVGGGSRTV